MDAVTVLQSCFVVLRSGAFNVQIVQYGSFVVFANNLELSVYVIVCEREREREGGGWWLVWWGCVGDFVCVYMFLCLSAYMCLYLCV